MVLVVVQEASIVETSTTPMVLPEHLMVELQGTTFIILAQHRRTPIMAVAVKAQPHVHGVHPLEHSTLVAVVVAVKAVLLAAVLLVLAVVAQVALPLLVLTARQILAVAVAVVAVTPVLKPLTAVVLVALASH